MDLTDYKNERGTYTSPRNGKEYKSEKALRAHLAFVRSDKMHNFADDMQVKDKVCRHCNTVTDKRNIKRHENGCYLNPKNLVTCKQCGKPIKHYKASKGTCSRSCANTFFKSGENNGNWKADSYRTTCFEFHEKKCVVCGEENIVAVHHLDENKENNDPSNLIPMCPTHHQYWHSGFRSLIEEKVLLYVSQWIKNKLSIA